MPEHSTYCWFSVGIHLNILSRTVYLSMYSRCSWCARWRLCCYSRRRRNAQYATRSNSARPHSAASASARGGSPGGEEAARRRRAAAGHTRRVASGPLLLRATRTRLLRARGARSVSRTTPHIEARWWLMTCSDSKRAYSLVIAFVRTNAVGGNFLNTPLVSMCLCFPLPTRTVIHSSAISILYSFHSLQYTL